MIFAIAESDFKTDSKEHEELKILSLLIEDYDRIHYPTEPSDPIESIKFRMEQQGLKAVDMKKYFGSTGRYYDIINKKKLSAWR